MPAEQVSMLESACTSTTHVVMIGRHWGGGKGVWGRSFECFFLALVLQKEVSRLIVIVLMQFPPPQSHPIDKPMSQVDPSQEKCVTKDTSGILQYKESIAANKKRREAAQHKKDLKAQGTAADESSDEEFDTVQAEIQAEEARKLRLMDEDELQKLWDKGEKEKSKAKVKAKAKVTETSSSSGSKVQAMGPAQKILATSAALSPDKRALLKRKQSSPSPKPKKSKSSGRSSTLVQDHTKEGAKCQLTQLPKLEQDSDSEDKNEIKDGSNTEGEDEDEDEEGEDEDSNHKSTKTTVKKKAGRGKMKDFTGKVKKMVDYTTIHVCAKLLVSGMFCLPHEYKATVNKCWVWAADEYKVDYQAPKYKIQKAHRQLIRNRVNSFHSRICDRLKLAIASTYELLIVRRTPVDAQKHIASLLPNVFHTKVGAKKGTRHFQHDYLQDAVFEAYYTGNNPIGLTYSKWFNPMPLEGNCLAKGLKDDDFAEDIPTVEELKILGLSNNKQFQSSKPPDSQLQESLACPSSLSSNSHPQNSKDSLSGTLPHSQSRTIASAGASSATCTNCSSSVTLDYEEETGSCESTPTPQALTPAVRNRPKSAANQTKDSEDDKDKEDDEEVKDNASSDDDMDSQPPPKKQKTKGASSLLGKLVAPGKKSAKPSLAAALEAGKFKISSGGKSGKSNV
ncbi:hypothetical protein OPQ81_007345 [Rhizoctonia solani]|nr:hypothetical protein OPQ81_007345 [Rhizoctonia solani]